MKNLVSTILILTAFGTITNVYSQSADEIVQKYLEALGGIEKLQEIKSFKLTGTMTSMGIDMPVTIVAAEPNKIYTEISFTGQSIISAFNGEYKWDQNPLMQSTLPIKATVEESEAASKEMYENVFIDYKKKGHTISYEGIGNISFSDFFKVRMTTNEGDETFYYFDQESYLLHATETTTEDGIVATNIFSEYDLLENGSYKHFTTEILVNGEISMGIYASEIEINPELDDSFFDMPE